MFEEKIAEKAEFTRIYQDPAEQERLGLKGVCAIAKHVGISAQLGYKLEKRIKANGNGGGEFDVQTYMRGNLESILTKLIAVIGDKGSAKHIDTALKLMGLLVEKREDKVQIEYTPERIAADADQLIAYLRESLETTGGACAVCGKSNLLLTEVCTDKVN